VEFDGNSIAYQTDGQVFLFNREKPDQPAKALTEDADFFKDLAWAPTDKSDVLAMLRVDGTTTQLCLGQITAHGMTPRCRPSPKGDIRLDRTISWSPTGKSLLIFGYVPKFGMVPDKFGMFRYTSKKPFSDDPDDWKGRGFVTNVSQIGEGVIDAQVSPDGKRLLVVHNFSAGEFRLYVTNTPNDFRLQRAKPLGVLGCKAIWRPDGEQILAVRADDCFINFTTGNLIRFDIKDPDV
jgi:hypothetical protein